MEKVYVVRQAELEDASAMAEIDKEAFSDPWPLESFISELAENPMAIYLVAEERGTDPNIPGLVIGYAGLWKVLDQGHITNVAVSSSARNRGVAKALLKELIALTRAQGIISHTLEVRVSNMAAISLYEGFGFVSAGVRKGYYLNNGEDALILWRY